MVSLLDLEYPSQLGEFNNYNGFELIFYVVFVLPAVASGFDSPGVLNVTSIDLAARFAFLSWRGCFRVADNTGKA